MSNPRTAAVDLTQGSVTGQLLRFTMPLILTGVLQLLYTLFDSLIVGNLISSAALASVNCSAPILRIFLFVVNGLVTGCMIQCAHLAGAARKRDIVGLTAVSCGVLTLLSILISALCLLFSGPLLVLLKTPDEILVMSREYFRVIAYGIPFLSLYNLSSAIARGLGDSRQPFLVLMTTSVLNVILDLLFVGALHTGIGGAALATVISQLVSAVMMAVLLIRQFRGAEYQPAPGTSAALFTADTLPLFRECIRLALPSTLRSIILSVGSLCITNVRNMLGPAVVEGISGAYNIDGFLMTPFMYVGNASSVFTGTNLAAGKTDRVRQGLRQMALCLIIYEIPMLLLILFCARFLLRGFGLNAECVQIGYHFLCTTALFYPFHGIQQIFAGYFEGRKRVTVSSAVSIAALGVRVALSYLLMHPLGADIVAWAEISSWIFAMSVLLFLFRGDRRRVLIHE